MKDFNNVLKIDAAAEAARIARGIFDIVSKKIRKRGVVIAMSGGIDSSVCAALAVQALGPKKVIGLLLPEKESSKESVTRGTLMAEQLGIEYIVQDISPVLAAIGCYEWRDQAIQATFPEYTSIWKSKLAITGGLDGQINHFQLVVQSPAGATFEKRLELHSYLQIVAAMNYKQRIRKTIEYAHADRRNYAVVGTPNRLEYDQGIFVKNGDGSADIMPIAHLYKDQVYQLGRYLAVPEEICQARPTTDTYSLPQGQDEFYFGMPHEKMDIALWAYNHAVRPEELASYLGVANESAKAIYRDIEAKRRATRYQHLRPMLFGEIEGMEEFEQEIKARE